MTGLDDRIVGISTHHLRAVPRTIAVAGGDRKVGAVCAALLGNQVDYADVAIALNAKVRVPMASA